MRRGNGHVLVEDLNAAPIVTVPDEASRGGGCGGRRKASATGSYLNYDIYWNLMRTRSVCSMKKIFIDVNYSLMHSFTVTFPPSVCSLSSNVDVPLTAP